MTNKDTSQEVNWEGAGRGCLLLLLLIFGITIPWVWGLIKMGQFLLERWI